MTRPVLLAPSPLPALAKADPATPDFESAHPGIDEAWLRPWSGAGCLKYAAGAPWVQLEVSLPHLRDYNFLTRAELGGAGCPRSQRLGRHAPERPQIPFTHPHGDAFPRCGCSGQDGR